jgi:hypothetical protein
MNNNQFYYFIGIVMGGVGTALIFMSFIMIGLI